MERQRSIDETQPLADAARHPRMDISIRTSQVTSHETMDFFHKSPINATLALHLCSMTDRTDNKQTAYNSATAASKASTAGIDGGQKASSNSPSQGLKMPTKEEIEGTFRPTQYAQLTGKIDQSRAVWADGIDVPYRKESRQNKFEKS